MTRKARLPGVMLLAGMVSLWVAGTACGNGGPFIVKYPGGDPAAKGVLARLDPGLLPGRESRLRVLREDLTIGFQPASGIFRRKGGYPPLVQVTAEYTIHNPTSARIDVDFGFPILRGIYVNPMSMLIRPEVAVTVAPASDGSGLEQGARSAGPNRGRGQPVPVTIISNSIIYGRIRHRAYRLIEDGIARDERLAPLVWQIRGGAPHGSTGQASPKGRVTSGPGETGGESGRERRDAARAALRDYLLEEKGWSQRDAALMVEYAGLDFSQQGVRPAARAGLWVTVPDGELRRIAQAHLGPLAAIGEQKATQFFAQLATRFDPSAQAAYEAVFRAWGGEVRERSVDLKTGAVRPREIEIDPPPSSNNAPTAGSPFGPVDPTVYARVDYLDPHAKITEEEKEACRRVLKNLPVVFTFAPMNLLHYRVGFPSGATQIVTVRYRQYAYLDTRAPASYQLAYVVHPASFWDEFGPIDVRVEVPAGIQVQASVPLRKTGRGRTVSGPRGTYAEARSAIMGGAADVYETTLADKGQKTGELFVAIGRAGWDRRFQRPEDQAASR